MIATSAAGNPRAVRDVQLDMDTVRQVPRRLAAMMVVALVVPLLVGCGGIPSDDGPTLDAIAGSWELVSGRGPGGGVAPPADHPITLSIDGSDWDGTAACNHYGAEVALDGGQLSVTQLMQTEMACPVEGAMEAEAAYLAAFQQITAFRLDGELLVLEGEATELRFRR